VPGGPDRLAQLLGVDLPRQTKPGFAAPEVNPDIARAGSFQRHSDGGFTACTAHTPNDEASVPFLQRDHPFLRVGCPDRFTVALLHWLQQALDHGQDLADGLVALHCEWRPGGNGARAAPGAEGTTLRSEPTYPIGVSFGKVEREWGPSLRWCCPGSRSSLSLVPVPPAPRFPGRSGKREGGHGTALPPYIPFSKSA